MKSIIICGPTASGKTKVAVQLARKLRLEIISADSRQVYKELTIGSGKDLTEYGSGKERVPVHLLDVVSVEKSYTLWDYTFDFWTCVNSIAKNNTAFIWCGGTGLYLESILRNFDLPTGSILKDLRQGWASQSLDFWVEKLRALAPDRAEGIDLKNPHRVLRELEKLSQDSMQPKPWTTIKIPLESRIIYFTRPRAELYSLIEQRLQRRMKEGLLEEVQGLLDRGISPSRLKSLGMEYKHLCLHLVGEKTYTDALADLNRDIRHLAKRQDTWFRGMQRRGLDVWTLNSPEDLLAINWEGFLNG